MFLRVELFEIAALIKEVVIS